MRSSLVAILALSSAAILAACGGSAPPADNPSSAADAGSPAASGTMTAEAGAPTTEATTPAEKKPTVATTEAPGFDTLPKDKKVEIMMSKVVPNVGKVFKEHDATRYAKFGCATCHGPQKREDPHKVLPVLTMKDGQLVPKSTRKSIDRDPKIGQFMMEKVVPAMAEALGQKPYDPATKTGFGCGGCHTIG